RRAIRPPCARAGPAAPPTSVRRPASPPPKRLLHSGCRARDGGPAPYNRRGDAMPKTITAAVQDGPGRLELRDLPRPVIGPDDGLLRVEACGICGSDVEQLRGEHTFLTYPLVPGHEPLGVIEEVSERAAARWGVRAGDRVVVEAIIPCRACATCLRGQYPLCPARFMHGFAPLSRAPGVWG